MGHAVVMGGNRPHHPLSTMTRKQIRDLRQFAEELAADGRTAAAAEVLALIARQHA